MGYLDALISDEYEPLCVFSLQKKSSRYCSRRVCLSVRPCTLQVQNAQNAQNIKINIGYVLRVETMFVMVVFLVVGLVMVYNSIM